MSKRIEKDGKFYRMRRGKLVEIPEEWVGNTVHPQTIRNRASKVIHKLRKAAKGVMAGFHYSAELKQERLAKKENKKEESKGEDDEHI